MRLALIAASLMLPLAASAKEAPAPFVGTQAPQARMLATPELTESQSPVCRDTVQQVRRERGLPSLDKQVSTGNDALAVKAVDHRINGCSMMVMHGNTADVRPLPAPAGEPKVQPAR